MQILTFSDIHFGSHQNSLSYNKAALRTVEEYIQLCKQSHIKYGVFQGDWHNHRITIDVQTLHYSRMALQKLNQYFKSVDGRLYFCLGNHDLYYRRNRDINSLPFITENLRHIEVISEPLVEIFTDKKILFLPWLTPSDDLPNILGNSDASILIGHQEYSGFKWNINSSALTIGISPSMVKHFKLVLSGHYHSRQKKGNIEYIGSCLQMNFGDCNEKRGYTLVNLSNYTTEFIENTIAPKYYKIPMSHSVTELGELGKIEGNHIKIIEDIVFDYEKRIHYLELIEAKNPASLVVEPINEYDEEEVIEADEIEEVDTILIDLLSNHIERKDKKELVETLRAYL